MRFQYIKERDRFVPIIPLKLFGKQEWVTFDAYVDSGATYSIFKQEIAEILGIEVANGEKLFVAVADGSLITAYLHHVKMNLANKIFDCIIGFSKQLGIGFNIIGRKGVFENFIITFNERERYIEFIEG